MCKGKNTRTHVEQHTSIYAVPRRDLCITQISLLLITTDIPVRPEKSFTVSLLKIYGIDTRREHKLTAGTPKNEHPRSFLGYKFAGANLILLETTALLGSSDTLRINLCAATAVYDFP